MAVGAVNYIILTTNGSYTSGASTITFNEEVPASGYPFMLVSSAPFEILQANSKASTYVMNVTREQEDTVAKAGSDGTTFVCELTHESLSDIYDELLTTELLIGNNASSNPSITGNNEINVNTTDDKVYIAEDSSWHELCLGAHSDYSGLTSSVEHTQYYTEDRATTWHGTLEGEHLDTVDHDHSVTPAANIRDLNAGSANESPPSDTSSGGVYYNKDNRTIYYYESGWQQYNTVPQYAMIFRDDGGCPAGWTQKTDWSGKFLKGEATSTWTGGSGGSSTHTHDVSTVPQHAHTVPDRDVTLETVSNHSHTETMYLGGSNRDVYTKQSYYYQTTNLTSTGNHKHTVTVAQYDTNSGGTVGASSQSASSLPKYVTLTLCEKD